MCLLQFDSTTSIKIVFYLIFNISFCFLYKFIIEINVFDDLLVK